MSALETNSPNQLPQQPKQPLRLENFISPSFLQALSESSEGFRIEPDYSLPPNRTGYTNLETRTIYFNPLLFSGSPELGIKPWGKTDVEGFCFHEAGHHHPAVLAFDNLLRQELNNAELIPQAYRGDPASEKRFIIALRSHLQNALVDVWLESFMGRRPHYPIEDSIRGFQRGKGDISSYHTMALPDQLLQFMLRSRDFGDAEAEKKLSPAAFEAYSKLAEAGVMPALMDRSAFENYFASPNAHARSVERKVSAYRIALQQYLKLMEAELENRKEERQAQKGQGQGKDSSQGGGSDQSSSVPLTKEEEQEIIQEILEELEKAGKEWEQQAPSKEDQKRAQQMLERIGKAIEQSHSQKGAPTQQTSKPQGPEGAQAISQLSQRLLAQAQAEQMRGLAEAMGVRQESIKRWHEIRAVYKDDITSMAASLAEIFLEDRRWWREYMKREGDIVPGLEFETIAAVVSGDIDPDTRFKSVRHKEFLETEIEFIVDTSGSMSGNPLEKSIDMMVVVTEALKKVRESLEEENMLSDDEQPLRVGVTTFDVKPMPVTPLDEPLSAEKEIAIIDKTARIGGGTSETKTIEEKYAEMALKQNNVLKIIVVLSDGIGDKQGVWPIIKQIEDDNQVIFLALGLGNSEAQAQHIVETYLAPLTKPEGQTNIFGKTCTDIKTIVPYVISFIKEQVEKRRSQH